MSTLAMDPNPTVAEEPTRRAPADEEAHQEQQPHDQQEQHYDVNAADDDLREAIARAKAKQQQIYDNNNNTNGTHDATAVNGGENGAPTTTTIDAANGDGDHVNGGATTTGHAGGGGALSVSVQSAVDSESFDGRVNAANPHGGLATATASKAGTNACPSDADGEEEGNPRELDATDNGAAVSGGGGATQVPSPDENDHQQPEPSPLPAKDVALLSNASCDGSVEADDEVRRGGSGSGSRGGVTAAAPVTTTTTTKDYRNEDEDVTIPEYDDDDEYTTEEEGEGEGDTGEASLKVHHASVSGGGGGHGNDNGDSPHHEQSSAAADSPLRTKEEYIQELELEAAALATELDQAAQDNETLKSVLRRTRHSSAVLQQVFQNTRLEAVIEKLKAELRDARTARQRTESLLAEVRNQHTHILVHKDTEIRRLGSMVQSLRVEGDGLKERVKDLEATAVLAARENGRLVALCRAHHVDPVEAPPTYVTSLAAVAGSVYTTTNAPHHAHSHSATASVAGGVSSTLLGLSPGAMRRGMLTVTNNSGPATPGGRRSVSPNMLSPPSGGVSSSLHRRDRSPSANTTNITPRLAVAAARSGQQVHATAAGVVAEVGRAVAWKGMQGTVRYVGPVVPLGSGVWIGVELQEGRGEHSGAAFGKRYFSAAPRSSIFCRVHELAPPRNPLFAQQHPQQTQQQQQTAGHQQEHHSGPAAAVPPLLSPTRKFAGAPLGGHSPAAASAAAAGATPSRSIEVTVARSPRKSANANPSNAPAAEEGDADAAATTATTTTTADAPPAAAQQTTQEQTETAAPTDASAAAADGEVEEDSAAPAINEQDEVPPQAAVVASADPSVAAADAVTAAVETSAPVVVVSEEENVTADAAAAANNNDDSAAAPIPAELVPEEAQALPDAVAKEETAAAVRDAPVVASPVAAEQQDYLQQEY